MKKLGLIGGMGPESTIPYYRDIVYGIKQRVGKDYYPQLTIESVNVFKVLKLCRENRHEELTNYLLEAINNLERSGAEIAALSANTPHIVFDRLKEQTSIPLISIIEATCREAEHRGLKKIGLLGTIFTMTGDFYKKPFYEKNIEIVVPSSLSMEFINEKITKELELGIVKEETRKSFQKIIMQMKDENNIQAVILGCTELPLILNDEVSSVPCLDTMQIHIASIINAILG